MLLAAAVLGYPSPILINWNQTFSEGELVSNTHLAKITGLSSYLDALERSNDQDLVMILDGLDAWLQLKPSVMVERYHHINNHANERMQHLYGRLAVETHQLQQKIIFSTDKVCWPVAFEKPGCFAVPDSTLAPTLYGPRTDTDAPELAAPEHYDDPRRFWRPKWLNSGGVVGTVKEVRHLADRAKVYSTLPEHDYKGSDQGIYQDIFGDQEIWRQAEGMGLTTEEGSNWYRDHIESGVDYEFGIGLDYEEAMVLSTAEHKGETAWIRYGDRAEIERISVESGMIRSRMPSLPADIARSGMPFEFPQADAYGNDWNTLPLITNLRSGITPVVIHHNAWAWGAKELINTTWGNMWYQPHAEAMYRHAESAGDRLQQTETSTGEQYEWVSNAGIIRTDSGGVLRYSDVCAGAWEDLFASQIS